MDLPTSSFPLEDDDGPFDELELEFGLDEPFPPKLISNECGFGTGYCCPVPNPGTVDTSDAI